MSVNSLAAIILFAQSSGGNYVNDGYNLAGFLSSAGHDVQTRFLSNSVSIDWTSFCQILNASASTSGIFLIGLVGSGLVSLRRYKQS